MYKSEYPLIVVFKNFFRSKCVNLSTLSIRHFLPNAKIFSVNLYKHSESEYESQPKLENITEFFRPTKYFNIGPSAANPKNNLFFSEGYNLIFDIFKDTEEKVLMTAEDHFYTTGQTLKELIESDFDAAYGGWNGSGPNASFLCIKPSNVKNAFPIPEVGDRYVEPVLNSFLAQIPKKYQVSTRGPDDNYHGDGIYCNDAESIEKELLKAKILC